MLDIKKILADFSEFIKLTEEDLFNVYDKETNIGYGIIEEDKLILHLSTVPEWYDKLRHICLEKGIKIELYGL